jgi:hypothetical protein
MESLQTVDYGESNRFTLTGFRWERLVVDFRQFALHIALARLI